MHIDFFIPLWIVHTVWFIVVAPVATFIIVMFWLGFSQWRNNRK